MLVSKLSEDVLCKNFLALILYVCMLQESVMVAFTLEIIIKILVYNGNRLLRSSQHIIYDI